MFILLPHRLETTRSLYYRICYLAEQCRHGNHSDQTQITIYQPLNMITWNV